MLSNNDRKCAARMAAVAEAVLFCGFYYAFVVNFLNIDTTFRDKYLAQYRKQSPCIVNMKMIIFALLVVALPACYGWTIMNYPCKWDRQQQRNADTAAMVVEIASVNCHVEDMIRSPWSLLVGPTAFVIFVILFAMGFALDGICFRLGCKPLGYMTRLNLQAVLYPMLDSKLHNLFFHRSPIRFSACASLYFLILVEMSCVSALTRSCVAFLVGLAIGDIFLRAANLLLVPPQICIVMLEGQLKQWSVDRGLIGEPLWLRFAARERGARSAIKVSSKELEAILQLSTLKMITHNERPASAVMERLEDVRFFEDPQRVIVGSLWVAVHSVLFVKQVFVADTLEIEEIEEDKETRGDEGYASDVPLIR